MMPLRFALVGDPVAHSKSPRMHAAAFRAMGLPHTYEAIRVTADELPAAVHALRSGAFAGFNVTVPHKLAATRLADEAHTFGTDATNTLVRTADRRIVAHNTDVTALREELGSFGRNDGRALVLGSGGAARAALAALAALGVKDVAVRARTPGPLVTQPWEPSPESEARTCLVVQATTAGMNGGPPGEVAADVVAWDALPADAAVLDVVYAPAETPFLRAAARRGLPRRNGLGMLARQGAAALELWLGRPAPLDAMLAALEEAS
ncbi:MAG TPA: shikimate dehydrogenase [Polyangiaceae bacterium]